MVAKETVLHSSHGIFFSNKKKQPLMDATTLVDLESIMLSKETNKQTEMPISKSHVMYGSIDYHSRHDQEVETGSALQG